MCRNSDPGKQTGAGLPIALFIITVLALLVVGMAQLQQSTGKSISLQVQSQRAFFAAESGAQVAVQQVLGGNSCAGIGGSVSFPSAGLAGCNANLTCNADSGFGKIGGSGGDTLYSITSSGQCGTGVDGAHRVIEVRVR
jgi:MSHA biogenesis protein MshP